MSPGHVLRACSLAASTILRHTSKFRRWEAKWKKQVTGSMPWRLHLGSSPFVSLCFPSTKRWAASATWSCSHDPGWWTEISDTVSSNKTPPHPHSCFYLFCQGTDKLAHILTFLCWANGDSTGNVVSIGWQHYEIREQDRGGSALTATPLPPSFSTSIYVLHGFKSDSTVLIIMLNIFLLDFFPRDAKVYFCFRR